MSVSNLYSPTTDTQNASPQRWGYKIALSPQQAKLQCSTKGRECRRLEPLLCLNQLPWNSMMGFQIFTLQIRIWDTVKGMFETFLFLGVDSISAADGGTKRYLNLWNI